MMASASYQGKAGAVACNALGETGKGLVNYPVSQKRPGNKRVVLARGPAMIAFTNLFLAGPVAWGARRGRNRRAVRHDVLHDAGIVRQTSPALVLA